MLFVGNMGKQKRLYPRQLIDNLVQQLHVLRSHIKSLEQQQSSLSLQHQVLSNMCAVLHALRTGSVNNGWMEYRESWLPGELPLLQELGAQIDQLNLNSSLSHQQQQQEPKLSTQQQGQSQQQEDQQQLKQPQQAQHTPLSAVSQAPLSYEQELAQQRVFLGGSNTTHSNVSNSSSRTSSFSSELQHPSPCPPVPAAAGTLGSTSTANIKGERPATAVGSEYFGRLDDPMAPLKFAFANPPFPGAADMTLEQLVQYYTPLVKEASLNLSLLDQHKERGADAWNGSEHPLVVLNELMLKHTRCIATILLLNPDDLLHRFRIVNLNTMEMSDNAEQAWKRTCWLTEKINLSEQQQHALIAGGDLFKRLLDTVRTERQRLSAQQHLQAAQRLPTGRAVDLSGQQETAQRLQLLVRKERFLLTCASGFVCSVLTVEQIARCCVLVWPWTPHFGMLAAVLSAQQRSKHAQAQEQAQQQEAQGQSDKQG